MDYTDFLNYLEYLEYLDYAEQQADCPACCSENSDDSEHTWGEEEEDPATILAGLILLCITLLAMVSPRPCSNLTMPHRLPSTI